MTDRELFEKAYAVPLHEQLASVPENARLVIDDPDGMGTRFIPVGRLCHEAAAVLRERLAQPEQWEQFYPDMSKPDAIVQGMPAYEGPLSKAQRTHWEGCEEVHPECRKQEQEAKMLLIDEDTAELVLEALENVTKDYVENRKRTHDRAIEQLYKVFTQKPQRREWVGLKDEEIMEPWPFENRVAFARWLEAKLKDKNNG